MSERSAIGISDRLYRLQRRILPMHILAVGMPRRFIPIRPRWDGGRSISFKHRRNRLRVELHLLLWNVVWSSRRGAFAGKIPGAPAR